MMRLVLCLGIFVAVCLVCTTVFAQGEAVKLRLSSWDTDLGMNLAVTGDSLTGTNISAKMLGLRGDNFVPSLELIFYQSRFKLTLGYWEAFSKGTEKLTTPITFKGKPYNANDDIDSKLKITSYDFRAQLDILSISRAEIGVVGGVRLLKYYVQVVDRTLTFAESDEAYAGSPYYGAAAEFLVQNLFAIGANVVTFSYRKGEFKLNSYLDANFYAEFRIGSNIAARAGYNNIKINFEKTDAIDMEHYIKGPYVGIYIAF
jgi:hypothetical protein